MCENTLAESPQGDIFLRGSDEHLTMDINDPDLYAHVWTAPTSLSVEDMEELFNLDAWQKAMVKAYWDMRNKPQEQVVAPSMVQYWTTPAHRRGRTNFLSIVDEWESLVPPKIDQTKLQDDAYLKVLREQVLERIDK